MKIKLFSNSYLNRELIVTSPVIEKLGMLLNRVPERPIFIVGTGRCGTTLLVRILRSHPEILGFPAEANALWHPNFYPREKAKIIVPPIEVDPHQYTETSIESWPPGQVDKIRYTFAGYYAIWGYGKEFFVKSAMISFMIPKILEIFPDARFIHIFRSGPPVVESFFKKNFERYKNFEFSEEEYRLICANYWNTCILEIEQVKQSCELEQNRSIFEISYEELCNRPKYMLKNIASFIGLREGSFGFDISQIESRNYKVGDYLTDKNWADCLQVMEPGMQLKGYL